MLDIVHEIKACEVWTLTIVIRTEIKKPVISYEAIVFIFRTSDGMVIKNTIIVIQP